MLIIQEPQIYWLGVLIVILNTPLGILGHDQPNIHPLSNPLSKKSDTSSSPKLKHTQERERIVQKQTKKQSSIPLSSLISNSQSTHQNYLAKEGKSFLSFSFIFQCLKIPHAVKVPFLENFQIKKQGWLELSEEGRSLGVVNQ